MLRVGRAWYRCGSDPESGPAAEMPGNPPACEGVGDVAVDAHPITQDELRFELGRTQDEFRAEANRTRDEFRAELSRTREEFQTALTQTREEFQAGLAQTREEIRAAREESRDTQSRTREEFRVQMNLLRTEIVTHYATKEDLHSLESRLVRWMIGLMIGSVGTAVAIAVAADRLWS